MEGRFCGTDRFYKRCDKPKGKEGTGIQNGKEAEQNRGESEYF